MDVPTIDYQYSSKDVSLVIFWQHQAIMDELALSHPLDFAFMEEV
jgi:hypothetical protein